MRRWTRFLVVAAALSLLAVGPLWAQSTLTGQTSSGAFYQIAVPDGWAPADGLVIWNHGFSLAPIVPDPGLGPLAQLQLAEGYAVAASSYSLRGWAVFATSRDNEEMVEVFEHEFGVPHQVFVYGASLGGLATVRDIEESDLGHVVGALPICGALAGSRNWFAGADLRLVYDAVCGDVPGAAIPGGVGGLPFPPDPAFDGNALAQAVHICTGVLAPPTGRTADQQARLGTILGITGLPESFLLQDMGYVTFALFDLVWDPAKMAGANPFGNRDVDYGDAEVNATIARVDADPGALERLMDNYTPTGRVGDVRIVSIHTDKDGLVIVENESEYASVAPANRLTTAVIVEDQPTHCGFSQGELVAAWESLRGWVAGLPQPTAESLRATCQALVAGELAEGPCRIDPAFVIPDLDNRIRARSECEAGPETLCLGTGDRFQVQVDWETTTGSGAGRAVPATDSSGSFWFFNPDNLEMTVKVLDGRANNGHFWVFFGALTNVEFELTVTDTETGLEKTYRNPAGHFESVGDTTAF